MDALAYWQDFHQRPLSSWLPTLEAARLRHGLPGLEWTRFPKGRNAVFGLGERFILKLTPPMWWQLEERAALEFVAGKLPLPTPELVAVGETELEGEVWTYMVQTRVRGRPLHEIWYGLNELERTRLAHRQGELMAEIHRVSLDGVPEALPMNWAEVLTEQRGGLLEELQNAEVPAQVTNPAAQFQRAAIPGSRVPEPLIADALPFVDSLLPRVLQTDERLFLHGDVNPLNVLVDERLELIGLVDFSDAKTGPREHEMISPIMNFYYGKPGVLSALYEGYGQPFEEQAVMLRSLLWYGNAWAHRLSVVYGDRVPSRWADLAESFFGF